MLTWEKLKKLIELAPRDRTKLYKTAESGNSTKMFDEN